jgi:hypothetical protein
MPPAKQWTIAGAITTVAVAVGLWTSLDPWPRVGWVTPNKHAADIKNTQTGLQVFRDEWTCNRWMDELTKLYEDLDAVENRNRRLRDQINRRRGKMDDRQCDRFGRY